MARLVLAWLDIADADRLWIERLRARHDSQQGLAAAHFTLVFPFDGLGVEAASRHVETITASAPPIRFRLTGARAARDSLSPRSHVFLLPDEGRAEIERLHDRLYAGPLSDQLRADIPFAPHVTVADFADHEDAEALAREINGFGVDIAGRIEAIDLVEFDGVAVTSIAAFDLAGR